ncbi:hypothetical protein DICA2_E15808 [Diutina catenulata]
MADRKARIAELRAKRLAKTQSNGSDLPKEEVSASESAQAAPSLEDIAQKIASTQAQQTDTDEQASGVPVKPLSVSEQYQQDIKPLLDRSERDTSQKINQAVQEKYGTATANE